MVNINKKGQASITDALIFLAIVSVVSTMLIVVSMNYGLTILKNVKNNYEKSYVENALTTLYHLDYGRDGNDLFNTKVSDALMTMVKEDYGVLGRIRKITKKSLFKSLRQVFLPFPSKGYMLIYFTEIVKKQKITTEKPILILIKTALLNKSIYKSVYLDCNAKSYNDIISFMESHGKNLQITESKVFFFNNILRNNSQGLGGTVFLLFWDITADFDNTSEKIVYFVKKNNKYVFSSKNEKNPYLSCKVLNLRD